MAKDLRYLLSNYFLLHIRDIQYPSLRLLLRSLMMHISMQHDAILEVTPELNEPISRSISLESLPEHLIQQTFRFKTKEQLYRL